MKYTELKNSITSGAAAVYLLEGDDAYFRMKGEEQIKAAFLQMPELNYTSFDGEALKGVGLSALVAAVRNYPFMAEKRIVRVSEFYPADAEYEKYLKPLFDDFPPTSIFIIVNSGAKKGCDLKRRRAVTYIDCNRAEPDTVAKWAYITLKRAGVTVSTASCEAIAAYCLNDMARVSVEVEKLIDYKGGGELTRGEIDELVFKDADYKLYELTNAAAVKNYTRFCAVADELVTKSGDETYLLLGLYNYFKNLLIILEWDGSPAELAATLKMKEYGVKKSREQAENVGGEKLKALVERAYKCVSDVKCGKMTPQSALQCFENVIFFS